jgi:hypothetical protein
MSQWLVYEYMAVEPSAFCAFGIQTRKENTVFFYDLWGVARGGSQAVLGTYGELGKAKKEFDRLVRVATREGG